MSRPSVLGRGLSSLLGDMHEVSPTGDERGGIRQLPISSIEANPDQPRRVFDEDPLNELADSIRARGLLQPLLVRPRGTKYQIVAGERRWRACQLAKLDEVPVIVREFDDGETLEVALLENIQRQDLNAIEEADAYQRLIAEYGHTQEALAQRVHKSRSHIANLLRLLDLPPPVRAMVGDGRLSMGHARALVSTERPEAFAEEVLRRGLSVRDTEQLVRGGKAPRPSSPRTAERKEVNSDIEALQRQLGDMLGLDVTITHGANGGVVALNYASLDQLDMICQRLSGERI